MKLERRKLVPNAPLFVSRWNVAPDRIEGHIDWQRCERKVSWSTQRQRLTRSPSLRTAGTVMLGAAGLISIVAIASYPKPEKTCGIYGCEVSHPDRTGTKVLAATGLGLIAGGLVMLVVGSGTKVETLATEPSEARTSGSCLSDQEQAELLLVLSAKRALWPIRLDANGDARVLIPQGERVEPGMEMKVIVYRAPANGQDLPLARGQILETLQLPPPAGSPPPPASEPATGQAEFPEAAP